MKSFSFFEMIFSSNTATSLVKYLRLTKSNITASKQCLDSTCLPSQKNRNSICIYPTLESGKTCHFQRLTIKCEALGFLMQGNSIYLIFFKTLFFMIGFPCVALAVLEPTLQTMLASDSKNLCLSSVGLNVTHHHCLA